MEWDDRDLLAGLDAAVSGDQSARFEPTGIMPERRLPLTEALLERGWILVARPLRGDGRLIDARGVELTQAGRTARAELRAAIETESPRPVDADALWEALDAQAEDGSPMADAIRTARTELADRGTLQSGMAGERALQIASAHGLAWDGKATAFVAEYLLPARLDATQRALIDVAAELFVDTNEWPKRAVVVRRAIRDKGVAGVDEAAWSLPKSVGHSDGQTIILTAEGLASSPFGSDVLEALVAFARSAADAYLGESDEPTASTATVAQALELDPDTRTQLNTLLTTERFFLGSGHGDSDGWVYEVTANAADLQGCETIENYLRVRRGALQPLPVSLRQPGPVRGGAASPPLELGLPGMHATVAEHAGALFADGHYAQAIFEALKALEVRVREQSGLDVSGRELMDKAFNGDPPRINLRQVSGQSGKDEQEGFRFIFMGAIQGIRNPKGHDFVRQDDPQRALEYLALASLLFHRLDTASEDSDTRPEGNQERNG